MARVSSAKEVSMVVTCVTHPGDAHLDEFLTCSVVIATHGALESIDRREPSEAELVDPEVVVVDVGLKYEPELLNFDHHQFPRDHRPECALSLLARELNWNGLSVFEAFETQKWFSTLRTLDSKGPFALANSLGTTPDVVFKLFSPVEWAMVAQFRAERVLTVDHPLWGVMAGIGRNLLDQAVDVLQRVVLLQTECRLVECGGVPGFVLESDDTTAVAEWREKFAPGTAFSVMHDNRGPGWALFRYDDDERIDFSRLNGRGDVNFAHVGGFIAKTADRELVPLGQALQMVKLAVVTP